MPHLPALPDSRAGAATQPLRRLAGLLAAALVLTGALVSGPALSRTARPAAGLLAPADTDTVAVQQPRPPAADTLRPDTLAADTLRPDTLRLDSLRLDSLAVRPDTGRAARYLPRLGGGYGASLLPRRAHPLTGGYGAYWQHQLTLDSTGRAYIARERVGEMDVRYPVQVDFEAFRRARLAASLDQGWRSLARDRQALLATQRRGGLGLNITVPGGRQSAFTTIFGKPEVDLRVTGQADIRAGFNYRRSEQQASLFGRPSQLDPEFKQDLRLGITGTIGDKMRVNVNWDTENQFDYQNQIRLQYTGYEDEIIQSIEAGNVFLQTPSRLIRSGQSLFGIKSEFKVGGLRLTTVASQQEGQANSLTINGGAETTTFEVKPTAYDNSTHYFLGYYFRNRWEEAMSQPPNVVLGNGFDKITELEVWRLVTTTLEDENVRQAVALVDLGEPAELLTLANAYTRADASALPNNSRDQYTDGLGGEVETRLRDGNADVDAFLQSKGLRSNDYKRGQFKRLVPGRDYTFDPQLGFLSLRQRLQESEALAIAFRYNGGQVGDFAAESGGSTGSQNEDRLVLKLLRPSTPQSPSDTYNPAAWYLELRNIYPLGGRGLNPNEFELRVSYEPPGKTPLDALPGVTGQRTLLQFLGLDRINQQQAPTPDNQFDFILNYSIRPEDGLLIFPYLEPFGSRIAREIERNVPAANRDQYRDLYVFDTLYRQKKENAERDTQHDVYRIRGSYRSTVQDFYDLKAYAGLVPGSVRVTSGGAALQENVDFIVDYNGGTLTITNPAYITSGREVNISYEQNSFFNLQKKTVLGARADYLFSDQIGLGATVMQMNQRSPVDKFRVGEEPISNFIWGVDGAMNLEPRWLTRAIDALPFLQTKEPSSIALSGEFAQLRPGNGTTIAFDRARRNLREQGRDFKADELQGVSYIDDFEGFENSFSLRQAGSWRLAAAPDSIGRYPVDAIGQRDDSLRTTLRAGLAWYQLTPKIVSDLATAGVPAFDAAAVNLPDIRDVFPSRKNETNTLNDRVTPFDLYFDPRVRGPYNFTTDLADFLAHPEDTWGGITTRLPEGYNDFSLKNIEFVEFIVRLFPENGARDAGPQARLYVDLGSISEDVLPDGALNSEDGQVTALTGGSPTTNWARLPRGTTNSVADIDDKTGLTEDLGLDGLASFTTQGYDQIGATEQTFFRHFLDALDPTVGDARYRAEVAKAQRDPSNDDYHYYLDGFFDDATYWPERASIQQRFLHYFAGTELNGFEAQRRLNNGGRGNSRYPDTEDLNLDNNASTDNNYFQYELPLGRAALDSLALPTAADDFVVGEIKDPDSGQGTGWYQVRIPVRNFTRQVGDIQDFSSIQSIRLWTTGHRTPITIRLATLDLVGSQWQKADQVAAERKASAGAAETRFSIASVNTEENSGAYVPPASAVVSQIRDAQGNLRNSKEQSLVLRVENMEPRQQRGIYRTYSLDLLRYTNLRMFAHLHGRTAAGTDLADLPADEVRGKLKLFVRLGSNLTNDYYEYEQPLTPSPQPGSAAGLTPDVVWQTNQPAPGGGTVDLNALNLEFRALNQLKVTRDSLLGTRPDVRLDTLFWNVGEGGVLQGPATGFAPPGTRLGIKGNPSLRTITTIFIGVRHDGDSLDVRPNNRFADVNVWVNELRVSGYDETNGEAALVTADVKLADLGRIKANFQWTSDGFGGLESTLAERIQAIEQTWSVTGDLNLNKFIPERYGWSIPVSGQVQSNLNTQRFAPNRGDVRLESILDQIAERTDLDEATRERERQAAIEAAQTANTTRSFTARLGKQGSRSPLLRYTLDGLNASYSYSDVDARTPSQRLNDKWNWNTQLSYRFSPAKPRTVRPFWFLDDVPVVGGLGALRFNYLPRSLSLTGTATRDFAQSQDRPSPNRLDGSTLDVPLPEEVAYPLREVQSFAHNRAFTFQYNPFTFLNLSFDTNTRQSLSALGVDSLFSVVVVDTLTGAPTTYPDLRLDEALAQGLIDSAAVQTRAFELQRLAIVPTDRVLNRLFSGADGLRTDTYRQVFTATFQPNFTQSKLLNWLTFQDFVYNVTFDWQNGALGRNFGATAGTRVDLRGGLSVRPQELWRKFAFYRNLEEAQQEAEREAQERRSTREAERARARQEAERQRQEEERRREEAARREAEGLPPDTTQAALPAVVPDAVPTLDATLPADSSAAAADSSGGGFKLPLPNLGALLRRTVLALTGIRDIQLTYTGSRITANSNIGEPALDAEGRPTVDVGYSLLNALRGGAPSLGYRFGFDRNIPLSERILTDQTQALDSRTNTNEVQGRTALNLSKNLQVNLNLVANWENDFDYTYSLNQDGGVASTFTETGRNRVSTWAFGASYLDLFAQQLALYRADAAGTSPGEPLQDRDGNGVLLTNPTVVRGFREAFVRSLGTLDGRGLMPLPLPNWTISYTGLSSWPLLRSIAQSVSIRHGYSADYETDFSSLTVADTASVFNFGNRRIVSERPDVLVGGVRLNERFSPMVGLDVSWKGTVQTTLAWNRTNAYTLGTTNFDVGENRTDEISFTASYQRQGLKLPFIRNRLNNRITVNLTASYAAIEEQRYVLVNALLAAAQADANNEPFDFASALEAPNVAPTTDTQRFTVTPRLAYQFSNRVSADFTLSYENFLGDARTPSYSNVKGGFNVRVSISN